MIVDLRLLIEKPPKIKIIPDQKTKKHYLKGYNSILYFPILMKSDFKFCQTWEDPG